MKMQLGVIPWLRKGSESGLSPGQALSEVGSVPKAILITFGLDHTLFTSIPL